MTHPDPHPNAFKLSLFTGTWSGSGEIFANAWSPAASCEGQWHFGFDKSGHNLIHHYTEMRSNGQEFEGHGIFNLDSESKEILWFWFDSYGFPPLNPARGEWDGERLQLSKLTARGKGRTTFIFSHNSFTYIVEAQLHTEDHFSPVMRGEFRKQYTSRD
jgi:hypothetical protein